jgi:AcrR family transcriptional regulator
VNGHNATSGQIYASALRILESEGSLAVTMRRVAGEVGVTPMAIYHHFPNREALLGHVVNNEFEKLAMFFDRSPGNCSYQNRMIHIMDGYIDYALAHPRIFDYVFSAPRPGARQFPRDFRARLSPTLNMIADAAADGIRMKKFKRDDIWEIAMEFWALTHGYLMLYRAGRFHLSEEEFRKLVHRSLRRLLHGLTA